MAGKRKFEEENHDKDEEFDANADLRSILRILKQKIVSADKKSKHDCEVLKARIEELLQDTILLNKENEKLRADNLRLKNELCLKDAEIQRLKNEAEFSKTQVSKLNKEHDKVIKQLSFSKTAIDTSFANEDEIDSDSDNSLESVFTDCDTQEKSDAIEANVNEETLSTAIDANNIVNNASAVNRKELKKVASSIGVEKQTLREVDSVRSVIQSPTKCISVNEVVNGVTVNVQKPRNEEDLEVVFESTLQPEVPKAIENERIISPSHITPNKEIVAAGTSDTATGTVALPLPQLMRPLIIDSSNVVVTSESPTSVNKLLVYKIPAVPNILKSRLMQSPIRTDQPVIVDFSTLNDKVWINICSYLKSKDLFCVRRASKKIKSCADVVLKARRKHVTILSHHIVVQVQFLIDFFSSMKTLTIRSTTIPFSFIIDYCGNKLTQLESLYIWMPKKSIEIAGIAKNMSNLKSLFVNCSNVTDKQMNELFKALIHLEKVEIHNTQVTGQCFESIPPNVVTMLWKAGDLIKPYEKFTFRHLNLKRFSFKTNCGRGKFKKRVSEIIVEQMPNLEFLCFHFGKGSIGDLGGFSLLPLKEVDLKAVCVHESLLMTAQLLSVEKLSVDITRNTAKSVKKILSTFPNLKQLMLTIRGMDNMSPIVVQELSQYKSMEFLSLQVRNTEELILMQNGSNLFIEALKCLTNIARIEINLETPNCQALKVYKNLDAFLEVVANIAKQRNKPSFIVKLPLTYSETSLCPSIRNLVANHS